MPQSPPNHSAGPAKHIAIAIDLDHTVPWHHDCCEGILNFGQSRGWVCSIDPLLMVQGDAAQRQGQNGYDGVVGRIDASVAETARAQGIPVVNHWSNSPTKGLPIVEIDGRAGGQMVGEHLLTCGYRTLGLLDSRINKGYAQIEEGLGRVADGAGLEPPSLCLLDMDYDVAASRDVFGRFLETIDRWLKSLKTPAGLYISDVTLARYLAQRCVHLGLSVPQDIGIVAWNDDMSAMAVSPTLSALEHDWFKVGYEAAAMLDELMQGKAVHPLHRLITPDRIIQRDSTDVFLCEDELVRKAMQYIAENCRSELKVQDVAEALHVSDRTLYRRFDQEMGRSIKDEIKRLRIDRLKLVVQETQMPLGEIADSFGFSSAGQFSRYFGGIVGMTPSAYRVKFGAKDEA